MRLNRTGKIIRNLLVCLLLWLGVWTLLRFPPYTLEGMCRRVQQEYLLEKVEPVYVLREPHKYTDEMMNRMYTFVIARTGEDYISFQYDQYLLQNQRRYTRQADLEKGALCMARLGTMYVAGAVKEAAFATAVVETTGKTFTLEGQRLGDEVFGFVYADEEHWYARPEDPPPIEEMDLLNAVELWYWDELEGGGRSLRHEGIPCTVTLYDEAGAVLDTLELEVETYDIYSHH